MEIKYPICCGIDVHKSFIVAVIVKSDSIKPQYLKKRFSTFHNQLIQFRDWLLENNCDNVCMESTGKYYVPVYNVLEDYISNIVVSNPKWVRAIKGEKDDNKDAKWIADLFKFGIVRSSFIPSKEFRILRELCRYQFKLTNVRSSEKNRYQNSLTVGNCKVDMAFSDVFGKSASSIIDIILSNNEYSDEDILKNVHGRCKASNEEILDAVRGSEFSEAHKIKIGIVKSHMDYVTGLLNQLGNVIDELVKPYESYITLLKTIPGMSRKSAIITLSEISTDMSQFSCPEQLAKWAGLAPGSNESAGKKKSRSITKAGVYLKPCLVEVAHAAIKDKQNTYFSTKYKQISKRRGKKRAIIAIARKILVSIYHMIKTGATFNPTDLNRTVRSEEEKVKETKHNIKRQAKQLFNCGISKEDILQIISESLVVQEPQPPLIE